MDKIDFERMATAHKKAQAKAYRKWAFWGSLGIVVAAFIGDVGNHTHQGARYFQIWGCVWVGYFIAQLANIPSRWS